ncbi:AfsR/SARP family transcriptional regulator [Plantactinospora sp. CA-290183]|uniref:AfsR/SARP family transcriptional regulator n=1 Tax=Plantactinospora sp. CA-290183 TaxID=3240006 RepID=UPI003D8E6936
MRAPELLRIVPDQWGSTGRPPPTRGEVRLLGRVRLIGPDGPVALQDGPRLLLGLLALRPGEPVPEAELLAALDTTNPSDGALGLRSLRRQAALLVATLDRCGMPGALECHSRGYLLRVPEHRIDAHRFTRLVARGRHRMAAGDLSGAGRLFSAALAVWATPVTTTWFEEQPPTVDPPPTPPGKQPPTADPPPTPPGKRPHTAAGPAGDRAPAAGRAESFGRRRLHPRGWAAAELDRLRQARVDAVEDRWECALRPAVIAYVAAGGPVADRSVVAAGVAGGRLAREAVAELEAALVVHPLRVRLWELLLVAAFLARGRGAVAELVRRGRTVFLEQLGVEPPGRLETLAEAMRRGELGEEWVTRRSRVPDPGTGRGDPRPVPSARAPLPVPLTALLGRDDLLVAVARRLAAHRLVTLTGPGGAGKTRLAVAVAHRLGGLPASFVDLSPVDNPVRVPHAVAAALGVPDAGRDVVAALAAEFGSARALLVLDNCEHLVAGCAELVERLLARCPGLRVLATSRVALRVPAEAVVRVPTLALPGPGTGHSIAGLAAHPATRLFLDRARECSGRPVPEASANAVVRLCAELDGLPLAIELAAARTPLLTVDEIVARLGANPRLLRGTDRSAPDRHRSLDAVVGSSLAQLGADARRLFELLAVCTGGFDGDAARALGGPGAPAALAALVEASLVEPLPPGPVTPVRPSGPGPADPPRYRMLVPIRRHALTLLAASGAEQAARRALATYCLGLAERAEAGLPGADQERWLARLRTEETNLRAAMTWLAEAGAAGPAHGDLRLAAALTMYCRLAGHYREGRGWLVAALNRHPGAPAALRTRAATGAAMLAMLLCDYPAAIEQAELARGACRRAGDRRAEARVEQILGSVAREQARYGDSARHLATAAAIFAEYGDESGEARTVELRGFTAWLAGDLDRADSRLRAALRRYDGMGDAPAMASALMTLGAVAFYRRDVDRASSLLDAALQRYSAIGFPEGVGWAHNLCGLVELRGRRLGPAGAHLLASLAAHRQVGDRWRTASVLEALAEVARLTGAPGRGAGLLGAADGLRDEIGAPVPGCERADVAGTRRALRAELADRYAAAYRRGREMGVDGLLAADEIGARSRGAGRTRPP